MAAVTFYSQAVIYSEDNTYITFANSVNTELDVPYDKVVLAYLLNH